MPTEREFSAGGVLVRNMRGRPFMAAVRVKDGTVLALPKGHIDPGESAAEVLGELGYDNVEIRTGDGSRGAPDRAPFDGISVTATAEGEPPAALMDQLAPHGRLVCPVRTAGGERLTRFHAGGGTEPMVPVRFVPLVEDPGGD